LLVLFEWQQHAWDWAWRSRGTSEDPKNHWSPKETKNQWPKPLSDLPVVLAVFELATEVVMTIELVELIAMKVVSDRARAAKANKNPVMPVKGLLEVLEVGLPDFGYPFFSFNFRISNNKLP
jgi:hypothetical protein